jgi:hypothetical protein
MPQHTEGGEPAERATTRGDEMLDGGGELLEPALPPAEPRARDRDSGWPKRVASASSSARSARASSKQPAPSRSYMRQ